jgi:hypothetical protein
LNDSQWRALKKGLSNSRVTRFNSVRDFVDALDEDEKEAFRVEEPDRFVEVEDQSSGSKWVAAVVAVLLAGLAVGASYQFGYLDTLIERFGPSEPATPTIEALDVALAVTPQEDTPAQLVSEIEMQNTAEDADTIPAAAVNEFEAASIITVDEPESDAVIAGDQFETLPQAAADEFEIELDVAVFEPEANVVAVEPQAIVSEVAEQTERVERPATEKIAVAGSGSTLVDYSTLPPPTEVIPFSPRGGHVKPVNITVREDGPAVIIDFVRGSGLSAPLTLRLEEVGFSGSQSPWASGEYAMSDSGLIYFPAGQARGRISLTMASDDFREPDQQSTLRLRDAGRAESELAIVNVTLEDDDRRLFEARLPQNTIAFVSSKTTVSESDAAVQIDFVRFNPDSSHVEASFVVSDMSAVDGQDYFGPGEHSISFRPGQRSARLLVPIVQDAEIEGDETFVVELVNAGTGRTADVFRHIVVTIRDDD